MSSLISTIESIEVWDEFISEITSDIDWLNSYQSDSKWSDIIIGSKVSEEMNSPLGDKFNAKGYKYRKEDGLTDLSIAKINSLHEKDKQQFVINKTHFYPKHYDILIGHENSIYLCYEEMAKLTYAKSRLKVLISYNEDYTKEDNYQYISEQVRENFSKIIKQANTTFPENKETEYLLLIGQKNENDLDFFSYVFDINGITKDLILTTND